MLYVSFFATFLFPTIIVTIKFYIPSCSLKMLVIIAAFLGCVPKLTASVENL